MICQDCGKPLVHEKARRKLDHSSCEAESRRLQGLVGRLVEGLRWFAISDSTSEERRRAAALVEEAEKEAGGG